MAQGKNVVRVMFSDWHCSGFHEIQYARQRYVIIDYERLGLLADESDYVAFARLQRQRIDLKTAPRELARDPQWTTDDEGALLV